MLATSERTSPCRARLSRSSSGRSTRTRASSWRTVIRGGSVWLSVPRGPVTVAWRPSSLTSTPAGSGMGSLPIRDMLLLPSLPHVGQHLAADAGPVGRAVGQQAAGGRDDGDAEAAEDPRQALLLGVDAQAGLGDAADAADRPLPVGPVLEVHAQGGAD